MLQNFLPALKGHLLDRCPSTRTSQETTGSTTDTRPGYILLQHDRLYRHNIMRINYTTYDVRRAQDVINPNTSHCNVMILNEKGSSPYAYAKVLGVYHINAFYAGHNGLSECRPRRMEFLWVRWYHNVEVESGWNARKLDRVSFLPVGHPDSFGFVDPSQVLRGCHMIPVFSRGKVHPDCNGLSRIARDALDWKQYYVNRYFPASFTVAITNGL